MVFALLLDELSRGTNNQSGRLSIPQVLGVSTEQHRRRDLTTVTRALVPKNLTTK